MSEQASALTDDVEATEVRTEVASGEATEPENRVLPNLTFPELLRLYRKRAGLTQKTLARLAGVSGAVVYRAEKGESMPHSETVERMVKFLPLTPGEATLLLSSSENERKPTLLDLILEARAIFRLEEEADRLEEIGFPETDDVDADISTYSRNTELVLQYAAEAETRRKKFMAYVSDW